MIERIIDANLNRLNEGLRVVEEIARLYLGEKKIVEKIKNLRHKIKLYAKRNYSKLIKARDVESDKGKFINPSFEFKRKNIIDIFVANIKRVEESARVLEEILKLKSYKEAKIFKKIRFESYEIEKEMFYLLKQ